MSIFFTHDRVPGCAVCGNGAHHKEIEGDYRTATSTHDSTIFPLDLSFKRVEQDAIDSWGFLHDSFAISPVQEQRTTNTGSITHMLLLHHYERACWTMTKGRLRDQLRPTTPPSCCRHRAGSVQSARRIAVSTESGQDQVRPGLFWSLDPCLKHRCRRPSLQRVHRSTRSNRVSRTMKA